MAKALKKASKGNLIIFWYITRNFYFSYPAYFIYLCNLPHKHSLLHRSYYLRLIRIIADAEQYKGNKNKDVHSIYLLSSRRFSHPSRQEQLRWKLPRGHSDIFFPPTWDSGVLNHPEFPPARYPPVPGSGVAPKKNEKCAYRVGKRGDGERKRGVGCRLRGRRSTRSSSGMLPLTGTRESASIGEDTCQLRPPDTQRRLNYDRAKLVSIKAINFEFNNSLRARGYTRAVLCQSPAKESYSSGSKLTHSRARARLRAARYRYSVVCITCTRIHAIKLPAA